MDLKLAQTKTETSFSNFVWRIITGNESWVYSAVSGLFNWKVHCFQRQHVRWTARLGPWLSIILTFTEPYITKSSQTVKLAMQRSTTKSWGIWDTHNWTVASIPPYPITHSSFVATPPLITYPTYPVLRHAKETSLAELQRDYSDLINSLGLPARTKILSYSNWLGQPLYWPLTRNPILFGIMGCER